MKILLVGGGSGGHITPLLAVAKEIKLAHPKASVSIVSERNGSFNHILDNPDPKIIEKIYYINAGKYRRYHGEAWHRKIFDIKTIIFNIRDVFKLLVGVIESFWLLLRTRPDAVFIKGGYIGVPIGFACRLFKTSYVTHDSDALPGLTNRLIAKKAQANAVGMPPEHYPYRKDKIYYVGTPVTADFLDKTEGIRNKKRKELDLKSSDFLVLITGGSNGAVRLDKIVHSALLKLMEKHSNLNIIHQVGKDNEELYSDYPIHLHSRIRVADFLKPLSEYISAADAVVARAGATSITEIGLLKKPLIIVPNPYLSGGHQLKNAEIYAKHNAVLSINEHKATENPKLLEEALYKVMSSKQLADKLAENLNKMVDKNSAKKIASLLVDVAHKKQAG